MTHPLIAAAALVNEYKETLNRTKNVCECCGVTKYENFNEAQSYVELSAIVTKLLRKAALLGE